MTTSERKFINMDDVHRYAGKKPKRKSGSGSNSVSAADKRSSTQNPLHASLKMEVGIDQLDRDPTPDGFPSELKVHSAASQEFYDAVPISCLTLNHQGIITEANIAAASLLELSQQELTGQSLEGFITYDSLASFHGIFARVLNGHSRVTGELILVNAAGKSFYTHVEIASAPRRAFLLVIVDMSERKKKELELMESNHQFQSIVDHVPGLMWISDVNNSWSWVNKGWLDFTGRTLAATLGHGWLDDIHSNDLQQCIDVHASAFEARQSFSMEYRLRHQDGRYRYMLAKGGPRLAPNGDFLGFIGSCTDISERKSIEESLEQSRQMLRHLVSYQERVREDERKRIAREIHDDLGQNLLALRIDVSMLATRTAGTHPKLNEKVQVALGHIDATMKAVRAAINNLRPTVLDLGLTAAMEWQVTEFQRRSGISCTLTIKEKDFRLDDDRATALFRILQESLNNVLRHAQASHVEIELRKDDARVCMKVADNGVGIYPRCRRKFNAFGLIGIEERVNALGGQLHIESHEDNGTAVLVSIPLGSPR